MIAHLRFHFLSALKICINFLFQSHTVFHLTIFIIFLSFQLPQQILILLANINLKMAMSFSKDGHLQLILYVWPFDAFLSSFLDISLVLIIHKLGFLDQIINMKDVFLQESASKGVRNAPFCIETTQMKPFKHSILPKTHLAHLIEQHLHHTHTITHYFAQAYLLEQIFDHGGVECKLKNSNKDRLFLIQLEVNLLDDEIQIQVLLERLILFFFDLWFLINKIKDIVNVPSFSQFESDHMEQIARSKLHEAFSD